MLEKFKSIFSREALEVALEEVPSVLAELNEKIQKERLEESRSDLVRESNKLSSLLIDLSKKKGPDNYVNVLKDRFCEKGTGALSNLPNNYDELLASLSIALQDISGISFKEFRHFQFFKEDMSKIASQIKILEEKMASFRKTYLESREKKVNDILQIAKQAKEKGTSLERLDGELIEIERTIPFIKESLEKEERKLSEISNKLAALNADAHDLTASLEQEKSIIKQRIGTEFGSLDRLFKREQHENPKKHSVLQDYIFNAGEAFINDEGLEIRTILEELKPDIKKEDPEKYEKILELLRNMDFFDSLRQQYKGLLEKISGIRKERSKEILPLEKERNHLLGSLDENKAEISQLLSKRDAKTQEKNNIARLLEDDKIKLKGMLESTLQREVKLK